VWTEQRWEEPGLDRPLGSDTPLYPNYKAAAEKGKEIASMNAL
jgi:hypothetical protein